MDSGQLISFEQELKAYFTGAKIPFRDHSASFYELDFTLPSICAGKHLWIDAKEKRQRYTVGNWPDVGIPEEYLFIIDDLAARKVLFHAPASGFMVRNNIKKTYYFFSVADLFLMPKTRINRNINKTVLANKGKWLIDFRNGSTGASIEALFCSIRAYFANWENIFSKTLECYGNYVGERIGSGGIERKPHHWSTDVRTTR